VTTRYRHAWDRGKSNDTRHTCRCRSERCGRRDLSVFARAAVVAIHSHSMATSISARCRPPSMILTESFRCSCRKGILSGQAICWPNSTPAVMPLVTIKPDAWWSSEANVDAVAQWLATSGNCPSAFDDASYTCNDARCRDHLSLLLGAPAQTGHLSADARRRSINLVPDASILANADDRNSNAHDSGGAASPQAILSIRS
jgi:hypothetical protein